MLPPLNRNGAVRIALIVRIRRRSECIFKNFGGKYSVVRPSCHLVNRNQSSPAVFGSMLTMYTLEYFAIALAAPHPSFELYSPLPLQSSPPICTRYPNGSGRSELCRLGGKLGVLAYISRVLRSFTLVLADRAGCDEKW